MTVSDYFVHESSYIDDGVEIGAGTTIWYFCHILRNAKIGKDCIIGQNVCIESGVAIGDRCKIQNNVSVYKGVILEDEVFCGPSCVFTNVYNPRSFIERKHEFRPTLVKKGATIGANATVVCGATIGKYALVGAGAVVKQDVPDYAVVAGVPARQIGWVCKCGTSLRLPVKKDTYQTAHREDLWLSATCTCCGSRYALQGAHLLLVKEDEGLFSESTR
jgi:UDP-2-acetamido-3-amino-2,3-dideoxy-glucuronate N-acetyltransferase